MGVSLFRAPLPSAMRSFYQKFLTERGLRDENDAECIALYFDEEDTIIACGARTDRLLKQFAVSPAAEGTGACAAVASALVDNAFEAGIMHLMLCTKPENERMFGSLGFYTLVATGDAILMENRRDGLDRYLAALPHPEGKVGAVVCNCNPFTLGHRYLIDTASKQVDALHVFVLSEEGSQFSPAERIDLVRKGTADLKNCYVHESNAYLVSRATFPAYFIKDTARVEDVRTDLDLLLFCRRIAPALGISVRFVGTEPFCPVTRAYNGRMKELLPANNIELVELPRHNDISASKVRALMKEGDLETIRTLVPETTYDLIRSKLTTDA